MSATNAEKNRQLCEKLGIVQMFAVRKGDLYYRPGSCGYTASPSEAGRYTKEEGERELVSGEPMSLEPFLMPDHFADNAEGLWACAMAEGGLNADEQPRFVRKLEDMLHHRDDIIGGMTIGASDKWKIVHAKAPQRAEALWQVLCGKRAA